MTYLTAKLILLSEIIMYFINSMSIVLFLNLNTMIKIVVLKKKTSYDY